MLASKLGGFVVTSQHLDKGLEDSLKNINDRPSWLQLSPQGASIRHTVAAGAMGTLERPASVPFPPAWSPTKGGFVGLWWGRQINVFDMFLFLV